MAIRMFVLLLGALLLSACSSPEAVLEKKGLPITDDGFITAASNQDADAVEAYLALNFNPDAPDAPRWNGATPLMMVAIQNEDVSAALGIVDRLLDAGANPNLRDENGDTALTLAARTGDPAVIERLLEAGVDVNVVNKRGQSALSISRVNTIGGKDKIIAELLKAAGASAPEAKYRLAESQVDPDRLRASAAEEMQALAALLGCTPKREDAGMQTCSGSDTTPYPNALIAMKNTADGRVESIMVHAQTRSDWQQPEPAVERVLSRYLKWREIDHIAGMYANSAGQPQVRRIMFGPYRPIGTSLAVEAMDSRPGNVTLKLRYMSGGF